MVIPVNILLKNKLMDFYCLFRHMTFSSYFTFLSSGAIACEMIKKVFTYLLGLCESRNNCCKHAAQDQVHSRGLESQLSDGSFICSYLAIFSENEIYSVFHILVQFSFELL